MIVRARNYWIRMLISPYNKRLVSFHLVVACTFYVDFFMSGWILCNYDMIMGSANDDFINHSTVYFWIMSIQVLDIILNFLKMDVTDFKEHKDPIVVAKKYLKGTFVFDCIAVFPYNHYHPDYIFLRYLKLLKVREYQNYFNNYIYESLLAYLDKSSLRNIINLFGLLVLLAFTSHIFAVLWMLIGMFGLKSENSAGWIK